MSSEQ